MNEKYRKTQTNKQKHQKYAAAAATAAATNKNKINILLQNWREWQMHSCDVRKKFHPINHLLSYVAHCAVLLRWVSVAVVIINFCVVVALPCSRLSYCINRFIFLHLPSFGPFRSLPLPRKCIFSAFIMQSRSYFAIKFRASCWFPVGFIVT